MLPTDHAEIELVESDELPVRTLIAPPLLARELRLALTGMDLTIEMGPQDVVIISTDLFTAFQEWSGGSSADDPSSQAEDNWN